MPSALVVPPDQPTPLWALAAAAYLARYSGNALRSYTESLRLLFTWCTSHGLDPLDAKRVHLELFVLSRPSQPDQVIGTTYALEWYLAFVSVTASVVLGDKGRVVVPSAIRERRNWGQGTTLLLIETPDGMLLTDRATALKIVREQLRGEPLVDELLAERRAEAAADSVGD